MRYFYDLHIHSCLSPCGDMDMTPHNIAGMSHINGLDIIAVADHNTARNIRAVSEAAKEYNIMVVPAIEAESAENIHLLCLFPTISDAEKMGEVLEDHLPPIKNRPDIFGEQTVMNKLDEEQGTVEKLLINATDLPLEQIKKLAESFGGVCMAAHIDREKNGINAILGCVPKELGFTTLELSSKVSEDYPREENYFYITNSDAHYLTDISEKINSIELSERTIDELLRKLKKFI